MIINMRVLFVFISFILISLLSIIFSRDSYKNWKEQSYLMKCILFIQVFFFVVFTLGLVLALVLGESST